MSKKITTGSRVWSTSRKMVGRVRSADTEGSFVDFDLDHEHAGQAVRVTIVGHLPGSRFEWVRDLVVLDDGRGPSLEPLDPLFFTHTSEAGQLAMLRIITTPPQRAPDDAHLYILGVDPCWDFDRIISERKALGSASDSHPFVRWMNGDTGYSRQAPLTLPEAIRDEHPATVTIAHWFKESALPTMFELRQLSAIEWERARYRPELADLEIVRAALVRVHNVDSGNGPETIEPPREHGLITVAWMDALSLADRDAIPRIAEAAAKLGRGVNGAGKL